MIFLIIIIKYQKIKFIEKILMAEKFIDVNDIQYICLYTSAKSNLAAKSIGIEIGKEGGQWLVNLSCSTRKQLEKGTKKTIHLKSIRFEEIQEIVNKINEYTSQTPTGLKLAGKSKINKGYLIITKGIAGEDITILGNSNTLFANKEELKSKIEGDFLNPELSLFNLIINTFDKIKAFPKY